MKKIVFTDYMVSLYTDQKRFCLGIQQYNSAGHTDIHLTTI